MGSSDPDRIVVTHDNRTATAPLLAMALVVDAAPRDVWVRRVAGASMAK